MNDEITLKSAVDDFAAQGIHTIFKKCFTAVSATIYFIAHLIFTSLSCFNALKISKWLLNIFSLKKMSILIII